MSSKEDQARHLVSRAAEVIGGIASQKIRLRTLAWAMNELAGHTLSTSQEEPVPETARLSKEGPGAGRTQ